MFQIFPDMGNKHCSIIFKCSMYTCDLQHKKKSSPIVPKNARWQKLKKKKPIKVFC